MSVDEDPHPLDEGENLDLAPLMKLRRDAVKDIDGATKEGWLRSVEAWMGADWLAEELPHPMRDLWRRRDWLATVELLNLGSALCRLEGKVSQKVLREAADDVRSSNYEKRGGRVWEILAASMYDQPEHPVRMAAAGQPGYDFSVSLPLERTLRVSCKAAVQSAEETRFRRFGRSVYETVGTSARAEAPSFVWMRLIDRESSETYDVDRARINVRTLL